ncbi:MAG TPA: peptide-methionine (S)-S-oxide reductase MsrA [Gemmatimonadaceae bacterium]|nr:peptide-methionine (S)-S-oxide reductase MsrA [Gemmatimonadaceae bacterium]
MSRFVLPLSIALLVGSAVGLTRAQSAPAPPLPLPTPAIGTALRSAAPLDTAVFAGGCFWGIEGVFEHINGVRSAVSGYAGGRTASPSYEDVSTGSTGHAESVRVVYDPALVSYGQLLQVFFSVAHDPTQLDRQGPDHGTQYRSAIFYRTAGQQRAAESYVRQLTAAKTFAKPIVTQIVPLTAFYQAEDYHQDYMVHHPNQPYIVYNDAPKVAKLRAQFPHLYR